MAKKKPKPTSVNPLGRGLVWLFGVAVTALIGLVVTYYVSINLPPPGVSASVTKSIDSVTGCDVYEVLIVVPPGEYLDATSISLDKPPFGFSDYRIYASTYETQIGVKIFAFSGSSRTVEGRCIFVDVADAPPPNIQVVPQGNPQVKLLFSANRLSQRTQISIVYDARQAPDRDLIVSGNMQYKRLGFDVTKSLTFDRQPDHRSR